MAAPLTTEQQLANIARVRLTEVRVFSEEKQEWSKRTALVLDYIAPLTWELNRPLFGTRYHLDRNVRTLDDKALAELVPG